MIEQNTHNLASIIEQTLEEKTKTCQQKLEQDKNRLQDDYAQTAREYAAALDRLSQRHVEQLRVRWLTYQKALDQYAEELAQKLSR